MRKALKVESMKRVFEHRTSMRVMLTGLAPVLALGLSGCVSNTNQPMHLARANAADAQSPVPKSRYSPVIGGYEHHVPVGPGNWQEQNRRVAPPGTLLPRPAQGGGR